MAERFAEFPNECFDCGGLVRRSMGDTQGTCEQCGGKKRRETAGGHYFNLGWKLIFGVPIVLWIYETMSSW